jgi:uncharacterized membrane protein
MNDLKCPKCGKVFDDALSCCPNCGCTANESSSSDKSNVSTTDTGYYHEETIRHYGDVVQSLSKVIAGIIAFITVILFLFSLFSGAGEVIGIGLLILAFGLLTAWCIFAGGVLTKAFLYVYANISINIHEINMKTK